MGKVIERIYISLAMFCIAAFAIIFIVMMISPHEPSIEFSDNPRLTEYCYWNITDKEFREVNITNGKQFDYIYSVYDECVNRNLSIVSRSGPTYMKYEELAATNIKYKYYFMSNVSYIKSSISENVS
jgi:hypothetical protein